MLKNNRTLYSLIRRAFILPVLFAPMVLCSFTPPKTTTARTTLVLDAAHGGTDAGARGADNSTEKALTLRMCREMARLAPEYNIDVKMTREADKYLTLAERVEIADKIYNGIVVSLHVNQATPDNVAANDYEVIVSEKNSQLAESKMLAAAVADHLHTGGISARLNQKNLFVLRNTHPAIAIECGDINNAIDMAHLRTEKDLENTCRHILSGIAAYVKATAK